MKILEIIRQLCVDDHNKVSHSKVWSNVANLTATAIVLYWGYLGTLSDDMLLWYMLILSGHAATSKLIKNKFTNLGEDK